MFLWQALISVVEVILEFKGKVVFFNLLMVQLYIIEPSIAGLMGRNRGHWPEFQIRPHMSSREVLMVYILYSK